eukprot:UN28259
MLRKTLNTYLNTTKGAKDTLMNIKDKHEKDFEALVAQNLKLLLIIDHLRVRIKNMSDQSIRQLQSARQRTHKLQEDNNKIIKNRIGGVSDWKMITCSWHVDLNM